MSMGQAVGFIQKNARKFLFFLDDFFKDAKNNKLPAYSFIEPRFNDRSTPGSFVQASDQHPDHNVLEGDNLIRRVYEAIRGNQAGWENTLLVITYDEHGGLPDHVPPPATVNPGDRPPDTLVFNFERLGIRVPAVLVSPFIAKGTIVHNKVFDHTSIIATARKLFISDFANSFLTERDRHANTFEDVLTLASPRTDNVKIPKPIGAGSPTPGFALASSTVAAVQTANTPLNDFQQAMVSQILHFQRLTRLPEVKSVDVPVSAIATEQQASDYLEKIKQGIAKSRKGKKKASTKAKPTKLSAPKPAKKR
jgi:phospholipase C